MKVSILINNYNYGRFLGQCLDSINKQSVKADEVIVYDDGSTDNSIEIVQKYKFAKLIHSENFGKKPAFNQANAINQAFFASSGDIICLLDADDFFHEDKIKCIKEQFLDPEVVLVQHSYFEFINGEVSRTVNFGIPSADYKNLYYRKRWTGFFNPTSTLSFKRDYLSKKLPILPDGFWQVWADVRLSRMTPFYGKVVTLNIPLTYYRRHQNSDSIAMNSDYKKTLSNQVQHHLFVNSELTKLGLEIIPFRKSVSYLKFSLKSILPPLLVKIFRGLKNIGLENE